MKVLVGCCGFPMGMKKYFQTFQAVEIQKTFYQVPEEKTLRKWKELAPKDFIFTVKAFQGVTHTFKSPTWKRFKGEILGKKENYGNLKASKEVFDSWKKSLGAAKALGAKVILIQLPASFKENEENLKNAEKFFSRIKRNKISIALELRGWSKEGFKAICKKFDLIACVDPFVSEPHWLSKKRIAYFRLHGKYEKGRIDYKHKYSKKELEELKNKIEGIKAREIYVFFNNVYMRENAEQFLRLIKS